MTTITADSFLGRAQGLFQRGQDIFQCSKQLITNEVKTNSFNSALTAIATAIPVNAITWGQEQGYLGMTPATAVSLTAATVTTLLLAGTAENYEIIGNRALKVIESVAFGTNFLTTAHYFLSAAEGVEKTAVGSGLLSTSLVTTFLASAVLGGFSKNLGITCKDRVIIGTGAFLGQLPWAYSLCSLPTMALVSAATAGILTSLTHRNS